MASNDDWDQSIESTESDHTSTEGSLFRKSTHLWYDDGNIILVAGGVGFRVYSGILSEQSSDLAEILAGIPEHGSPESTFDGCPVVFLPDSPSSMQHLLNAMHSIRFLLGKTIGCDALCSILDLSSKYHISPMRHHAIKSLQKYFPPKLHDYLDAKVARQSLTVGDVFYLANVARTADVGVLLVPVLFCCATQQLDTIFDGVPYRPFRSGRIVLNSTNQRAILKSLPQLSRLARSRTLHSIFVSEACDLTNCLLMKRRLAVQVMDERKGAGFVNPLSSFSNLFEREEDLMCGDCSRDLTNCIAAGRVHVWEMLPEMFGLGSWEGIRSTAAGEEV